MNQDLPRSLFTLAATMVVVLAFSPPAWAGPSAKSVAPMDSASAAKVHARPVFGPLQAGQIAQIQGMGRSVLAAKNNQQPSEEERELVADLRALSREINQAVQPKKGSIELTQSNAEKRGTERIRPSAESARSLLQSRLAQLHERRLKRESALAKPTAVPLEPRTREARQARLQHLEQQVAEIERAVQDALSLSDDERHTRLAELNRKLKPRSQDELVAERQIAAASENPTDAVAKELESTPMLTTIVRHRPEPKSGAISDTDGTKGKSREGKRAAKP